MNSIYILLLLYFLCIYNLLYLLVLKSIVLLRFFQLKVKTFDPLQVLKFSNLIDLGWTIYIYNWFTLYNKTNTHFIHLNICYNNNKKKHVFWLFKVQIIIVNIDWFSLALILWIINSTIRKQYYINYKNKITNVIKIKFKNWTYQIWIIRNKKIFSDTFCIDMFRSIKSIIEFESIKLNF